MKNFETKIQKLGQKITPFGGIYYVISEFDKCGLWQLIDTELEARGKKSTYSYSDIFRNWFRKYRISHKPKKTGN